MENNLMELWAMLAVVAPGLYTSATRFREDYVKTVTDGMRSRQSIRQADAGHLQGYGDEDRQADLGAVGFGEAALARLRRRIRPVLLRRTKEQVAPDLPDRIQQELSVELAPKHRRAYDLLLQRERQRVLRLLDEDYEGNRFTIFRSLTLLRRAALDISLTDPERYAGVPSAKLDLLFEQLADVTATGHRALCSASSPPSCARSPNGPTGRGSATSTWTAPRDGGPRSSSGSRPATPRCS
jgi:SNF2 family DNA or RNA helicase